IAHVGLQQGWFDVPLLTHDTEIEHVGSSNIQDQGLCDAVSMGNPDGYDAGTRTILPASFTKGPADIVDRVLKLKVKEFAKLMKGKETFIHNSDNSNFVIIPFKLLGTENYRIWSGAVKLALQARNKCNAMVLTWIMNVVSQDVYMGLVYFKNATVVWKKLKETYNKVDGSVVYNLLQKINSIKQGGSSVADYYHRLNSLWREFDTLTKLPKCTCEPVRSSLLTRDPLPEVNDAYNVVSKEESHRGVLESFGGTKSKQNATSFAAKTFNNNKKQYNNNGNNFTRGFKRNLNSNYNTGKQSFNANHDVKMSDKPSSSNLFSGFTSEQIQKLLNLINDKSTRSIHANMAGSISGMVNVVDISDLKINVGHPNGTLAVINHVGNLKLANKVMLYEVLVDLKRKRHLGTGSESSGLYLFDVIKSNCIGQSNMVMNFHVSKLLWHNRLGHPADQVLSVLKNDLNMSDNTSVPVCKICQRAKQTRESFPLSDHKSKTLGELVHLDL
ncbi:ribonuclease H-like domain-containing protein, partial [Tanacetum coccineum]